MRSIIVAALLAALGCATQAGAAEPITKRQAREGKAADVNRQVLGQIGDLMDRRRNDPGKPLRTPLDFSTMSTVPRTTPYEGLCRQDVLWIEYAKAGGAGTGPDEPRRASGFTATSYFDFASPPPTTVINAEQLRSKVVRRPETAPCGGNMDDRGFGAKDDEAAAKGYLLFRRVLAEAPAASWPLDCHNPGPDKDSCRAPLAGLKPDDLARVGDCGALMVALSEGCTDFTTGGDMVIRVHTQSEAKGFPPKPGTILRVEVLQQLILYHERNYD